MADMTYPNDEAVLELGVLDKFDVGHDPGWAFDVTNRIQADILNAPRNSLQPYDRSDYTAEELAVYDYYTSEVIPIEKWKALVKEHQDETRDEHTGGDDTVNYDGYNPDHEYVPKPGDNFTPPANINEYTGESGGGGDLVVTTEAIEYFCKQLDAVAPQGKDGVIWQAIKELDGIDIKPGTFGKAVALRNKVTGTPGSTSDPGLRGDTRGFLVAVHEALFDLQKNLRTMMIEYDSAEEFNKLTGEQFKSVMEETWGDITKFSKYGNTSTTSQGNENEDGNDGDD